MVSIQYNTQIIFFHCIPENKLMIEHYDYFAYSKNLSRESHIFSYNIFLTNFKFPKLSMCL